MKLAVVIPVLNQVELASSVYMQLREVTNTVEHEVEFVILDNGSTPPLAERDFLGAKIVRYDKSIGVYPTFNAGFISTTYDIVAFFHSDLAIWEKNWNDRVLQAFEDNPHLGMLGFIGSNEIDPSGGRGLGTTSNFAGFSLISSKIKTEGDGKMETPMWMGSHASVHGKVSDKVSNAAVVDGCAMIISREAWDDIGYRDSFPLHHFYDRLISTQLLEKNWEVGVIGVQCDHFSGQTVCKEQSYHDMAEKWSRANIAESKWVKEKNGAYNWDATMYQEAERRWMDEYKAKGFIPKRV